MQYLKIAFTLIRDTVTGWSEDKAPMLAAGLAYYTIFSLAPLLVLIVAIASLVYGERAVAGELVGQIEGVVGEETAMFIENIIENANQTTSGLQATLISLAILLFGASGVFGQLQIALNLLWHTNLPKAEGLGGILILVRTRLLAIIMVLIIGFLVLLSMALNAALGVVGDYLTEFNPLLGRVLPLLSLLISLAILTGLFGFIFRALPNKLLAWRDVAVGAFVTALLFSLGQYGMGLYLGNWQGGSAYGAASSLILLLFWIYLSALVILFGAKFTYVYAKAFPPKPKEVERS